MLHNHHSHTGLQLPYPIPGQHSVKLCQITAATKTMTNHIKQWKVAVNKQPYYMYYLIFINIAGRSTTVCCHTPKNTNRDTFTHKQTTTKQDSPWESNSIVITSKHTTCSLTIFLSMKTFSFARTFSFTAAHKKVKHLSFSFQIIIFHFLIIAVNLFSN